MGIEPTARLWRATGFEDQGGHQTPIASINYTISRTPMRPVPPTSSSRAEDVAIQGYTDATVYWCPCNLGLKTAQPSLITPPPPQAPAGLLPAA